MGITGTLQLAHLDHVIDGVYIAGFRALYNLDTMKHQQILHVLKLYEYEPFWPKPFRVLELPIVDGEPLPPARLERGVHFIQRRVVHQERVLVQCGAGISRSATFVLAYLIERGMDLPEAYRFLQHHHPAAAPAPALWQSLIDYYGLAYNLYDVIEWMQPKPRHPNP